MAESSNVVTVQDLEAMTATERANLIKDALLTDADSIDERRAEVVARGRERINTRLSDRP